MADFPTFREFFQAVHPGFEPFAWQLSLAERLEHNGAWPADIGVPTGLGKTSTIDLAIWHLALEGARAGAQRSAPTRVWYVVNRRLLVDEAHNHALNLAEQLKTASNGPLKAVAASLADMQAESWDFGPLYVRRLRGGADRGFRPPDPSCPSIILSTVPMFGSRFLFRGYGSSAGMRPIDAAHAGSDSLVLLDEAHLAEPLQQLLRSSSELPAPIERALPGARNDVSLVNLTASGVDDPEFDIDLAAEKEHPVALRRLEATKPTTLVPSTKRGSIKDLATAAIELASEQASTGRQPAVVVFVNTAKSAPAVAAEIEPLIKKQGVLVEPEVLTVTGRLRPFDADAVRERLVRGPESVASGSHTAKRERTLFVVATQTLEVGADFDFDALVTESAGVRALVQRFGRLNRVGERPWAAGQIVHPDDQRDHPIYGDEPSLCWERLADALPLGSTEPIDLGPLAIRTVLGEPPPAPVRAPELLPNHLREWAKTNPPHDRTGTDVDPFISGEPEDLRSVTVIWRQAMPVMVDAEQAADVPNRRDMLYPLLHPAEAVDIPLGDVRRLLVDRSAGLGSRLNSSDGRLELVTVTALRPGDTIVLPCAIGGYRADRGWDEASTEPVPDLSFALRHEFVLTAERYLTLRRAGEFGANVEVTAEAVTESALCDVAQSAWSGAAWVTTGESQGYDEPELPAALASFEVRSYRNGPVTALKLSADDRLPPPLVDLEGDLSIAVALPESRATLAAHQAHVADRAVAIAQRLGLSERLQRTLRIAALAHDAGKADPRFQLLLADDPDVQLAKSVTNRSGVVRLWPRGGRHELLSTQLFSVWLSEAASDELTGIDADLALHLIGSHHGWGRPLLPIVCDATAVPVATDIDGRDVKVDADLGCRDSEWPVRFEELNSRYGFWGLAMLESVLRQADHTESSVANSETVSSREIV